MDHVPPDSSQAPDLPYVVVGLAAGPGPERADALAAFFAGLPDAPDGGTPVPAAFVVVDLGAGPGGAPDEPLAEALARALPLPVVALDDGAGDAVEPEGRPAALRPAHVYVVPPGRAPALDGEHIGAVPAGGPDGRPADALFRALAAAHGGRAIAVALAGPGHDGAAGAPAVREAGGLVLAEAPAGAAAGADERPRAALASGAVDAVGAPGTLAAEALAYAGWVLAARRPGADRAVPVGAEAEAEAATDAEADAEDVRVVHRVLAELRARTGHDFAPYKRSTVRRRLERRAHVVGARSLADYADRLAGDPAEGWALFDDLLVPVTRFFRDPAAFGALERTVVPALFAGKGPADEVRVWVAGCATGEEAYSVAVLLAEHTATLAEPPSVQVFGTDLSARAVRAARAGVYPEAVEDDVGAARLGRFFRAYPGGYRVAEGVRERVLFATHSLLKDPPFSRVDLVTCRNVLTYLGRPAQARALGLFHYALRAGGHLFLGPSETADAAEDLFEPVDLEHRLYRRRQGTSVPVYQAGLLALHGRSTPPATAGPDKPEAPTFAELHARLRAESAPPSVLVDENLTAVHLSEGAHAFLRFRDGEPTRDLLKLVQDELRAPIQTALYQLRSGAAPARGAVVRRVTVGGEPADVRVHVRPAGAAGIYQVVFEASSSAAAPAPADAGADAGADEDDAAHVRRLDAETRALQEQLEAMVEAFETGREELQAQNEELQSTNEELRSTAEELETSKEEAQSMAEELLTVNDDLRAKVDELGRAKGDLENLIVSTEIATLFLDRALAIKWFTPQVRALFRVRSSDVGRPLAELAPRFGGARLVEDAEAVLDRLEVREQEVEGEDGRWYLVHVRPYRAAGDHIDGVVVTFVEVTERHRAAEALRESERRRLLAVEAAEIGDWVLDVHTGRFEWSERALAMQGLGPESAVGLDDLYRRIHPDDREDVRDALTTAIAPSGSGEFHAVFRLVLDDDRVRWFESNGRAVFDGPSDRGTLFEGEASGRRATHLYGAMVDVTDRKEREEALRQSAEADAFRVALADALRSLTDPREIQAEASRVLGRHLGVTRALYGHVTDDGDVFIEQDYTDGASSLAGQHRLADYGATLVASLLEDRALTMPDIAADPALSAEERGRYASIGVAAQAIVPLVRDGRLVAVLSVHQSEPRAWTDAEVALLEETAERTWAVVQRARAEAAALDQSRRLTVLSETAADLLHGADPVALIGPIAARISGLLGMEVFTHYSVAPDGAHLMLEGSAGLSEAEQAALHPRPFGVGVTGQAAARREAVVVRHVQDDDPDAAFTRQFGLTTYAAFPLVAGDTLLGTMGFGTRGAGRWDAGAVEVVQTVCDYLAVAVLGHEAARALRESEETLRLLVENAREYAIIGTDERGAITLWSLGAQRMFGWTEAEALGEPSALVFTAEDRAAGVPEHETAMAQKKGQAMDDRWHVRKDGTRFWGSGVMTALRGPDGRLRGFAKILRDNTKRRANEQALRTLAETLEARVAERTRALQAKTQQARALAGALTLAEQRERHRIAEVLHDHIQQLLYGVQIKLHLLPPAAQDAAGKTIAEMGTLLGEALKATRALTVELSPPVLQGEGLAGALLWLATQMEEVQGLRVSVETERREGVLREEQRVLVFQLVRELLFNVVKHAGVSEARVVVDLAPDLLTVRVEDEGAGFAADEEDHTPRAEGGFGLVSLRDRLDPLGGRLTVDSAPGRGTRATITLPLQGDA